MTIEAIKSQIQDMVWDSDDEAALEKLLVAVNDILGNPPRNILDNLSSAQLAGLQQAEQGEGIPMPLFRNEL